MASSVTSRTVLHRRRRRAVVDAASARRFATEALVAFGAPGDVVATLKLVTSELVSNALRNNDGHAIVTVLGGGSGWAVEVAGGSQPDGHVLWDPNRWILHREDRSTGRGLGLVRALVDEITVRKDAGQAVVRGTMHRG